MRKTFWLDVITPSKKFFSGEVEEVIINTPVGKEGFLAKHSWTCKLLDAGELWIRELGAAEDDWKIASAAGGFVDVKDNYPWITTVNINGKQFGPMLMKNYPTNKEEEGIVFEVFADKKDRREYCEYAVNNTFVVLQSGKRVRAVDFYEL